jgi:cytochrome b subunit of formate dehydrogenase
MFRIVSITGFAITFVGIAFHCVFFRPKLDDLFDKERRLRILDGLRVLVYLLTLLLPEQRFGILGVFRKLVYFVALLCFVVLAVNGFYPSVVLGEPISGYYLMLQVTAGGVFAACLAVLAVMWAHRCRFDKSDWQQLRHLIRREASELVGAKPAVARSSELGQKICFWLITLLALPVILSIVLSMFTLFGTDGQEFLLQLHRYSALLLALVAIVHTYLIIRTQC